MAVETLENLRRLAAHHLPEMAREQQRAVLLCADGKTYEEIATMERVSMGTVKLRPGVASAEIAMCLEEGELTLGMRGVWVMAHYPCCLVAEAARLTEGDGVTAPLAARLAARVTKRVTARVWPRPEGGSTVPLPALIGGSAALAGDDHGLGHTTGEGMNVVSRILFAAVAAVLVTLGPVLQAGTAYAGADPDTTPVGGGLNPDDQGYASWSQRAFRTENDNWYCYYVYLDGHFRVGSTYYYLDGGWVGGYPSRVESGLGPTGTVEAAGSHNACLSDWTGCNGYASTLSYQ